MSNIDYSLNRRRFEKELGNRIGAEETDFPFGVISDFFNILKQIDDFANSEDADFKEVQSLMENINNTITALGTEVPELQTEIDELKDSFDEFNESLPDFDLLNEAVDFAEALEDKGLIEKSDEIKKSAAGLLKEFKDGLKETLNECYSDIDNIIDD